jgi:hypothetical protein
LVTQGIATVDPGVVGYNADVQGFRTTSDLDEIATPRRCDGSLRSVVDDITAHRSSAQTKGTTR